jgi:hypothetical protein
VSEYGRRRHAWYAQAAQIVAERLDCELVTFPGHHGSFMDKPDEFSTVSRYRPRVARRLTGHGFAVVTYGNA